MPVNINGSAPKLGKCELLLNGVPDIQGLSDLQFSISPEKAFEIIEGSNLYEDKFVFLREVIQNALDACKVQMWRDLSEGKYKSWISKDVTNLKELQPFEIEKGVFNNYGIEVRMYWCMLPLKKKIKLLEKYGKTFQKVERTIDILVRGTDNQFSVQPYDFKKVMAALNQIWIVHNLDVYIEYEYDGERMDIDSIEQLLNKNNVSFSMVLVDKKFIDVLGCSLFKEIMVIPEGRCLYLGIPAIDEKELPMVSDKRTKQYLMKNLLRKRRSRTAYMFSGISTRQYTIGIRGYEAICTTQVPFGLGGIGYSDGRYIISPITIKQWDNNKHLEEDKFVEAVCSCKELSNLLDYVYEHQLEAGKYSKQKIKESYESFIREMYRIMKEDEVNNEHEKNDHSLP